MDIGGIRFAQRASGARVYLRQSHSRLNCMTKMKVPTEKHTKPIDKELKKVARSADDLTERNVELIKRLEEAAKQDRTSSYRVA